MATQVTVSGTLKDAEGNNLSGTVTFTPTTPFYDATGNLIVGTAPVIATLASGAFSITLYATDDAGTSPDGATYTITEALTGADGSAISRTYRAEIPSAAATLRYEDLVAVTAQPVYSYATTSSLVGLTAPLTSAGWRLSDLDWFGHSYAFFTYSTPAQRPPTRLGAQLGVPVQVGARSGSTLLGMGRTWGGMMTMVGHTPPASRTWGDRVVPRNGASVILTGINDLNQYSSMDTADGSASDDTNRWSQFSAHWPEAVRFVTSWLSLGAWWPYSDLTGQITYGGTWANTVDANANLVFGLHTSYRYSGGSSSTLSFTIPEAWEGETVVLFFMAPRYSDLAGTIPSTPYASTLTFTIDGDTVLPEGHSSSLNTKGAPLPYAVPNTYGAVGHIAARIAIPTGAGGTTLLVTGSTGGISFEGIGVEAARPVRWCNIPTLASYTNDRLTNARVTSTNTATETALEDFSSFAGLVDIATPLDTDGDAFTDADLLSDGLHPNDVGAGIIADAIFEDLAALGVTSTTRRFL